MKIKEIVLTKNAKRTRATRDNGLTNYDSDEASVAITLGEPTTEDIKEGWELINKEIENQLDKDKQDWLKRPRTKEEKNV